MAWLALAWSLVVKALRWLLGSREGRIALLVIATVLLFRLHGHQRFRAGYAAAATKYEAHAARSRVLAAKQAAGRDDKAAAIGQQTQADTAARISTGNKASEAAQERTRDRIAEVPAIGGCAGPDAGILRDVQAADARVRAAADRMRRVGASARGQPAPGRQ